jgi:hypothetical protein
MCLKVNGEANQICTRGWCRSLLSVSAAWPGHSQGEAMTVFGSTALATEDSYLSTRDFDYGVHDEVRTALQQLRGEIAARLRQTAYSDPNATRENRHIYELAARIAETT